MRYRHATNLLGNRLGRALLAPLAVAGIGLVPAAAAPALATPPPSEPGYSPTAKPVTITVETDSNQPIEGTHLFPYQNVWIPAFEKAYPNIHVNVIMASSSSFDSALYDRIIAAQHSHAAPPVDITDSQIVPELLLAHAGVTVTSKEVPNMDEVDPNLLQATDYMGVPFRGSAVVLAYNSTDVPSPPTTLAGLLTWIRSHPGKFTYNSPTTGGAGYGFIQAVLQTNVPAGDLSVFSTGYKPSLESYWAPGLKTLASLKQDIYQNGLYPDGSAATLQLLANSDIWMTTTWSDEGASAIADHDVPSTVKLAQISNPTLPGSPVDLVVLKGSPDQQASFAFVNYMLSATEQSLVAKDIQGFPGVEWKYAPKSVIDEFGNAAKNYTPYWDSQYTNDVNLKWQTDVASS